MAVQTSAIASAVDLFMERYAADAADRCSLRQLMTQSGPQVRLTQMQLPAESPLQAGLLKHCWTTTGKPVLHGFLSI